MAPPRCFFCRKMKSQESGLTIHKFPLNDQYLLKQWLNNIPIKNWTPTKWTMLCSNHFAEDCFNHLEEGRVLLKSNSIPTRFDNPQAYCIYCKRKRIYKSGHSFFKFPLHKSDILKKWLDNMGIKNWIPNNNSLLCSEHFEETCFQKRGKILMLKERSAPTIFKAECLNDIKSAVLTSIEPTTSGAQLDTAQLDTAQLDTAQLDTAQLDTAQLDTAQLDTAQLDTAQLDTAQLDTAQLDTAQLDTAQLDTAQLDWNHSQNSGKPLDTGHYGWWYPIETWSVGMLPSSITVDNGNPLGTGYYSWWYPIETCSIGILPPSTTGFLQ